MVQHVELVVLKHLAEKRNEKYENISKYIYFSLGLRVGFVGHFLLKSLLLDSTLRCCHRMQLVHTHCGTMKDLLLRLLLSWTHI